jgi:RNA polymerase sigma-70 factor (ECF subfamily)
MAMKERDMGHEMRPDMRPDMDQQQWFVREFEQHRGRLRGVAYRMLGSLSEAEDAVQETWLRLSSGDRSEVHNLGGWLTTVISRVCLDMLRVRKSRREEAEDAAAPGDAGLGRGDGHSQGYGYGHGHGHLTQAIDPEQEAIMADAVGVALLVVLDALSPAERIAFVLHDLFGVSFDDIASIVQRSPEATRQLASRARRRVRREPNVSGAELTAHRELVTRFLAALRAGDVEGLVALLDPELVVHVDAAAAASGKPVEVHGARTWATSAVTFAARMQQAEIVLVDGSVGVVFAPGGKLSRVLSITIEHGRVSRLDVIADPARLDQVELSAFAV